MSNSNCPGAKHLKVQILTTLPTPIGFLARFLAFIMLATGCFAELGVHQGKAGLLFTKCFILYCACAYAGRLVRWLNTPIID